MLFCHSESARVSHWREVPTEASGPSQSAESCSGDSADSFLRDAAAISDFAAGERFPSPRLREGEVLSERFVIERQAGSGGMGAVYRALDRMTGAPVAVKVMARGGGDEGRFAQEGRVLAELSHPAIVRYVATARLRRGRRFSRWSGSKARTSVRVSGARD